MAHLADGKSLLDSRGFYDGATVHGVNPLLLVEKIIRERIFESLYWKEQAFGLNGKPINSIHRVPSQLTSTPAQLQPSSIVQ